MRTVFAAPLYLALGLLSLSEAAVLVKQHRQPPASVLKAESVSTKSGKHEPEAAHEAGGETEHGEGEHEEGSSKNGFICVLGFGSAVILFALSFALANHSNKKVALFTWRCLDNVISIFLAVLLFQVIDEVVIDAGILPKEYIVLGSFLYALLLLTLAVGMSQLLKKHADDDKDLAIFAASCAHFVSFGFMHAATLGFEHHSETVLHALYIFIAICILVPAMYVGLFYIKSAAGFYADDELIEKVDDIETDAGAMAFSISWTMLVCYFLTSKFQDVVEEEDVSHEERKMMLIYAVAVTLAGCCFILFVSDSESVESYAKKRLASFGSSAVSMVMAWAWLVWGKWYFHGHSFAEFPMFSRIWFAFIVSLVAITVIVGLGTFKFRPSRQDRAVAFQKEEMLLILTVSLVAGWSWEEAFDHSLETVGEKGDANLFDGAYKMLASFIMLAIVLPVHVIYFKPLAMAREKECEDAALEK